MKLKEFDIRLDIKRSQKHDYIEVVQGDYETNILNIQITENLQPYNLTGLSVEIAFAKPDNTTVLQDEDNGVTIEDAEQGKIKVVLKTNTIAAAGKVYAEVRIKDGDMILTTARFDFFVRRAIFGDDTIKSKDEWPLYEQLLEAAENENERISREQERIENENTRVANEAERQLAEQERINAENMRISNETTRQSNEQARINAELERQTNEQLRREQEDYRQASIADIENRWNQLTTAQQQDAEVIDARTSTIKEKTFPTLNARLEEIEQIENGIVDAHIAVGLLLNYARQNSWEIETGTVALTNSLAFPFNDSIQTISLSKRKENTGYIVLTEIVSASGNVGKIEITDKLINGFKIAHTGSAKSVTVKYTVIGGVLK